MDVVLHMADILLNGRYFTCCNLYDVHIVHCQSPEGT